jgi:SAM-dependent methyltransferase
VVIESGCGALRGGYWLIHFLDAERYHGIEPNREMVDGARRALLEPGLEATKQPRFAYNDDFDLGGFGVAPDFVLARSIWSHTSKPQIQAMLDSFARVAAPNGLLLASYHPASRLPWGRQDYLGDAWVGRGPESTAAGQRAVVAHRFGWIEEQCRARGLTVRETRADGFGGQVWLEVTRA